MIQYRLAVLAQYIGIPIADVLDAGRVLIGHKCQFCKAGTEIIRQVHAIGQVRAILLLKRIIEAKKANDIESLEAIKKEITS